MKIKTAFYKPGGKWYTDEDIEVLDGLEMHDAAKAWHRAERVVHFHRQGFHAVARFDEHPMGFPIMFVGVPHAS
jgi:hypothetical protein